MIALYAGSFDPVTLGHLDIISRASAIFDVLVVGVGVNPEKPGWIEQCDRIELLQPHVKDDKLISSACHVVLESYTDLTIEFARRKKAQVLVRGIRDGDDLRNEMRMARINRRLSGLETLFLQPSDDKLVLSSSLVRQIFTFGKGDAWLLRDLVPENVLNFIARKAERPEGSEDLSF